jgi:hypothetical protein
MIEAHVFIDRDLVIKGHKRVYGLQALRDGAAFYSIRAFYVILAVALVDVYYGAGHLISAHLTIIAALAAGTSVYHYFDWTKQLAAGAKDYELHVLLDDEGVTIRNQDDLRIKWDSYAYFKEYEDYLEITDKQGEISFLPKRDELAGAIVFTKSKISSYETN